MGPELLSARSGSFGEIENGPLWNTIKSQLYEPEVSYIKRLVGASLIQQNRLMFDEIASLRQMLADFKEQNDELATGLKRQADFRDTQHRDLLRQQAQIILEDLRSQAAAIGYTLEDLVPDLRKEQLRDFVFNRDKDLGQSGAGCCSSPPATPSTRPPSSLCGFNTCRSLVPPARSPTPSGSGLPAGLPLGQPLGPEALGEVVAGIREALEAENVSLLLVISEEMQQLEAQDLVRSSFGGRAARGEPTTAELQQFLHRLQDIVVSPGLRALSLTTSCNSVDFAPGPIRAAPITGGASVKRLQALIFSRRQQMVEEVEAAELGDAQDEAVLGTGAKQAFDPFFDDPFAVKANEKAAIEVASFLRFQQLSTVALVTIAFALAAAAFRETICDAIRSFLGLDSRVPRLKPLRSGRRIKVAILGGGIGGSAVAVWLRDLLGDEQVELVMFQNSPVGGRCQVIELDGQHYEAGAAIVSEMNVLFQALMRRFSLTRRGSAVNVPAAIFNGSRFVFCGISTAACCGVEAAAKLATSWKLGLRFGFLALIRLQGLSRSSSAPNFALLYQTLRDGATYAHPRELLSTLGHGCLRLTERPADQFLVREVGLPGQLVKELAEPGMRANYGGQGCDILHAFVGLVSICGGICSKCFAVCGGNVQVAERAVQAAKPSLVRGNARLVRRAANAATAAPWEPTFEVGYDTPSTCDAAGGAGSSPALRAAAASRAAAANGQEAEGLFMEAFHLVIVAHPLEQSMVQFEGCCAETTQVERQLPFRRCTAHFLRGTLKMRHFVEAGAAETRSRSAGGPYEDDPQASMPMFAPAQILTTADTTTPFYSIGLQFPVDTASRKDAQEVIASAERGEPQVYKVFASEPLPESELDKWFSRPKGSPVHTVDWYAYPQYAVPQSFHPFVLDQAGVYYVNAIEQVASAMEMSLIGARNVANLVADWVSQRRGPRGF
ncbi:unnamed protein product [Polarella glacialis]|uniref:Prenylcysteine lyase domain-containing protein n=1 Tax=Polarella glacialis TaxID=89957 RepID=A0A813FIN0_POLGL|nr:unnamed protein product [Polarella glacialis]